jgi:ATP-dependent Lhr-like helicase
LLEKAQAGRSVLLVAPTGAGKTLAGFLPTLVDLAEPRAKGEKGRIHTLYISPLKALAVDIARNLETPVAEMRLPIRVETRTGDTPAHKRARQIERPPDILLTTPEQLALLLAHREASELFVGLKRVVLDELHSLVTSKRGDLLALGLARLHRLAPDLASVGLSATVREPDDLRRYLVPQAGGRRSAGDLVVVEGGAKPDIRMLEIDQRLPLAGHTAALAMPAIYDLIRGHKTTLVFVNTRLQAEFVFQELWNLNEDGLPIALHHGSLDATQRRRVEAAMAAGELRGVVCTATLDLGIDWGDVDLVVNVGAPKGRPASCSASGRSNHRMDEPSQAYLVPANRFEILECRARLMRCTRPPRIRRMPASGASTCSASTCSAWPAPMRSGRGPLRGGALRRALPRSHLRGFRGGRGLRGDGGYALRAYERFAKIVRGPDGLWRVRDGRVAQQYRLNVGTIVEATKIKVRLARANRARPGQVLPRGGRVLGEVEEDFAESLTAGDTFLFAGEVLRFEGMQEDEVLVTRASAGTDPKIPAYAGGKFPLSTFLAERVRAILADPFEWDRLPGQVTDWLLWQRRKSVVPGPRDLLVETFPRGGRYYMTCFPSRAGSRTRRSACSSPGGSSGRA